MRGRHLTLFVPGLSGPVQALADGDAGPGRCAAALDATVETIGVARLETLLSRASYTQAAFPDALEAQLASLFGLTVPTCEDLPVAALTHAFDSGRPDASWYLRADPVHVRANLRELILNDGRSFALELTEARELASLVNMHYAQAGWRVEVLQPTRWYIAFERPQRLRTTPLSLVNGSSIGGCMPVGEDAPRWHAVLNEIQMLLHQCEPNARRAQRGQVAVNGLWLWGGGRLPAVEPCPWDGVYTDEPSACALAWASGTRAGALPESLRDWCGVTRGAARALVILDTLFGPARCAQVENWVAGLAHLNTRWFEQIPGALRRGVLDSVEFILPPLGRYTVTRRCLVRWWRRRRSLGTLVEASLRTRPDIAPRRAGGWR